MSRCVGWLCCCFFFVFQAEYGIREAQESRGLGDVYKRQGPLNEPGAASQRQVRFIHFIHYTSGSIGGAGGAGGGGGITPGPSGTTTSMIRYLSLIHI